MATRETLGVAIVGAGWCASQHIAAFQRNPRTWITWVCGRDLERTRAAAASAGAIDNVRITTDFEAVLDARDVDIVSITTPNHLHADQAVAAAKAGKHIVLEKPTGLDAAELVRIRDAVRSAGVRTIVSYCSRAFTLEPGDLIATGTPAGVGVYKKPPRLLRDGDEMVIRIQGIGDLRNRCRTTGEPAVPA